jgi:L-fuculose-phosphate aldolase
MAGVRSPSADAPASLGRSGSARPRAARRRGRGLARRLAELREARAVIDGAREILARDLVVGTVGNVSARVDSGMLITPTRFAYDRLRMRDLVWLAPDGAPFAGRRAPSREWRLHAAIYVARPDVGAIVHTHSLHATAWSFSGRGPLPGCEELDYFAIGPVAASAPAPAASQQLADHAVAALGGGRAVLLGEHGVVATGAGVADAVLAATVVERAATVACLAAVARAAADAGPQL